MPNMTARTTAAVLLAVFSLVTAFFTWKFTVASDTAKRSEISPDVLPSAVHFKTSTSRVVASVSVRPFGQ
jgi:hypothetical protein